MQRREFLADTLKHAAAVIVVGNFSGCGTLMYSERVGRPHTHQIDWKVAALDGLGLILFFVPGVIAFIVDFSTGAIYLPPESITPEYAPHAQGPGSNRSNSPVPAGSVSDEAHSPFDTTLKDDGASPDSVTSLVARRQHARLPRKCLVLMRMPLEREKLQREHLETVVSEHVGQTISLNDAEIRLSEVSGIDEYNDQVRRHQSDRNFGQTIRSFFSQRKRV